MASRYYDVASVMQVIGCTFNNPSLLDLEDKYIITELDFEDEFHKAVFGAIYKLHELGAKEITLSSLDDFFSTRPKWQSLYKSKNGEKWVCSVAENANPLTFDYYYQRMKKMSLLRGYESYGINVESIYDMNNIFDMQKKQIQEEWLDNASLQDIVDEIDKKIDEIKLTYSNCDNEEASQAGDGIEELINSLQETPEVGVPLYGPLINTITRGARLKKFYIRSASTGTGKAIPNSYPIPTPNGWKTIGDIKVGDYLFGQDGKLTKVLAIHPQPTKKKTWKVVFKDGRTVDCCEDHLWEYRYESHNKKELRVESTKDIYNRAKSLKNGFKDSEGKTYRFAIKINEPVQYSEKKYSLPPYAMGLALGDGSFRYTKNQKGFCFSSGTEELPKLFTSLLGDNYIYKRNSKTNYNYVFKPKDNLNHNLWVEELLADYPELWNTKSEDKFIPIDYMQGSVEQRYELLAGLLDTDGNIDKKKGRVSFSTISPKLRDNVIELCHSLGMITSYHVDKRVDKYTTGECYNIHIQCKPEIKPKLFKLSYKHQIAIDYLNNGKRKEYKEYLPIVDIYPTEEETDMTCFTVDNSSHLFLVGDFVVTHNTRSMVADICYIGCDKIYQEDFGWINAGVAEPCLFIITEQDLAEAQTMMLAFLSNVNEEHILNGKYEGDELDRVREAAAIIKRSPIYVEELPDFSLQDIENVIKKNIREHGVKYIALDYIHSSMKILEEITRRSGGVKLREDNILFMLSAKLKEICNVYGVFIESATQLNGQYQESDTPDQNLLRGSKAIADRCDTASILLSVTQKDVDALEKIIAGSGFVRPNLKLSVYKNRRGRYKGIYLWCKADLGTCRIEPQFATTWNYELLSIEDMKIETTPAPWEKK